MMSRRQRETERLLYLARIVAQADQEGAPTPGEFAEWGKRMVAQWPWPLRWNYDKPHRCPACHAVAVSIGRHPTSWHVYTCCRCGVRFTRWPRLAPVLRKAGVMCEEHRDA